MMNRVSPQADISGRPFRGLSTITPLLASLSTDNNIIPAAILQIENPVEYFLIGSECKARFSDYLQHCISIRLERLALAVYLRKGDAATLMAGSAGGQAVASLSFCLCPLYCSENVGVSSKT